MPRKKDEEVAKKTAQVGLVEWKNSNGPQYEYQGHPCLR
jgi:hypothetical protein